MSESSGATGEDSIESQCVSALKSHAGIATISQVVSRTQTDHSTCEQALSRLEGRGVVALDSIRGYDAVYALQTELDGETVPVETVETVNGTKGRRLRDAGYGSLSDVESASLDDLTSLHGISEPTVERLLKAAGTIGASRTLEDLSGVGESKAATLREAGYESVGDVQSATVENLAGISGISTALAERLTKN